MEEVTTAVIPGSDGAGDDILFDYNKELECLMSSVVQVQDKFIGQWAGTQYLKSVEEQEDNFEKRMRQHEENVAKMKSKLEQLRGEEQSSKEVQVERATEVKNLQERLVKIRQDTDKLLLEREQMEKMVAELQRTNAQEKELLASQEQTTEETINELQKSVTFFKDRLGLQMKKISGERLQFVFTCIDSKDPARPFHFCVRIKDRSYEVTDCEPAIEDFDSLVQRLNDTNNFRSFVITVRRKFRDLV